MGLTIVQEVIGPEAMLARPGEMSERIVQEVIVLEAMSERIVQEAIDLGEMSARIVQNRKSTRLNSSH